MFDGASTSDERRWIKHVEERRGRRGHHLNEGVYRYLTPSDEPERFASLNFALISSAYASGLKASMDTVGARVLLSGHAGDHVIHGTYDPTPQLADLLQAGRLRQLHHALQQWGTLLKKPYAHLLWTCALMPLWPAAIRSRLARGMITTPAPWYSGEFSRRWRLRDRLQHGGRVQEGVRPRRFSDRFQAAGFASAVSNLRFFDLREAGVCDVAFPYLDRRLVEFLQAIPYEQKLRVGETRSILRRALKGILPDETSARRGKGNPVEVMYRAVSRDSSRLRHRFETAPPTLAPYVSVPDFLPVLSRTAAGSELRTPDVLRTILLERWLTDVFERRRLVGVARDHRASRACTEGPMTDARCEPQSGAAQECA